MKSDQRTDFFSRARPRRHARTDSEVLEELNLEELFRGREEEATSPALALAMRDRSSGRSARREMEQMNVWVDLVYDNKPMGTVRPMRQAPNRNLIQLTCDTMEKLTL
jgi:hypothetical protein